MQDINFITIFLTGLFTGGLTCLAVQGGLLATTLAYREEHRLHETNTRAGTVMPILAFLGAKLLAYTLLGALLGLAGSAVQLSITTQALLQMVVALYMLASALNVLDVHPLFRYIVIQPPKAFTRLVRKQSKRTDTYAPAFLGFFTVLIPCGTTQAMMALAIGSANPILGATIMLVFVLGTSPLFFTLGYFTTKLGNALQYKFSVVTALILIFLSVYTFMGALALTGYGFGTRGYVSESAETPSATPVITIRSGGYYPGSITVASSSTVRLNVINENGAGCEQAFTIPKLGLREIIPPGTSKVMEFTAPSTPGQIAFMCSMGMYQGVINVI